MISNTHRFHGRAGLRFVYQHGRGVRGDHLSLRLARNPREHTWRMAVVVSRKVSKSAVVRNRIRRRIFEIVRRESVRLGEAHDLVFNAHNEILATMSHAELEQAVLGLLQQARVLESTLGHAIVDTKKET